MPKPPRTVQHFLRINSVPIYYLIFAILILIVYRTFFVAPEESKQVRWAEKQFDALSGQEQLRMLLNFKKGKTIRFAAGLGSYSVEITPYSEYFSSFALMRAYRENPFSSNRLMYVNDTIYFHNAANPGFVKLGNFSFFNKMYDKNDRDYIVRDSKTQRPGVTCEKWNFQKMAYTKALDDGIYEPVFVDATNKSIYLFNKDKPKLLYQFRLEDTYSDDASVAPFDSVQLSGNFEDAIRVEDGCFIITTTHQLKNEIRWLKEGYYDYSNKKRDLPKVDVEIPSGYNANPIYTLDHHYVLDLYWEDTKEQKSYHQVVSFDKATLKSAGINYEFASPSDEYLHFFYDEGNKVLRVVNKDEVVWMIEETNAGLGERVVEWKSTARADSVHKKFELMKLDVAGARVDLPPTRELSSYLFIDSSLPTYFVDFSKSGKIIPSGPIRFNDKMLKVEVKPNPYVIFIILVFLLALGSFGRIMIIQFFYEGPSHDDYLPEIATIPSLRMKIMDVDKEIYDLKVRYNSMLFIGLTFGILGVGALLLVLESTLGQEGNFEFDGQHVVQLVRVTVMLIFIETLAFFFLRQYRVIYNEYKLFYSVKMRLLNYASVISLADGGDNAMKKSAKEKIIDRLLSEKIKLYNGELSAANDYPRAFKETLDAFGGKVVNPGNGTKADDSKKIILPGH